MKPRQTDTKAWEARTLLLQGLRPKEIMEKVDCCGTIVARERIGLNMPPFQGGNRAKPFDPRSKYDRRRARDHLRRALQRGRIKQGRTNVAPALNIANLSPITKITDSR